MTSTRQVLTDNMSDDQIMAEWKRHTEACRKSKDKDKMFDQMNSRYTNLLNFRTLWHTSRDPKTSSEASFTPSIASSDTERPCRATQSNPEFSKEIIDNVPIFEGKESELNQFVNTIESFANLYRIPELKIVMLQTKGKPNEIITHAIEDDPEASWPIIKRKLINNYGATKSRIDAGIQIKKCQWKNVKQ